MIELRDITWDNFWDIINLKTYDSQTNFLPSNAIFMAEAYINLKFHYPDVCFAIYNDDVPIGFTKIVFVQKNEKQFNFAENTYYIDALMIGENYQGKGYGKAALTQILHFIEKEPWGSVESIKLSCYDENEAAIALYRKFGFKKTKNHVKDNDKLTIYVKDN